MQSYESSEWNTDDLQNGMCCVAKRMISVTIKCHSPIQWLPKASSSTSSVIEEKELPIVRLLSVHFETKEAKRISLEKS
ncbi:hypothetical protein B9Z55_022020 [Caenorhabditis nigoni]|nr:hypothetical protein B9Z55_022020 [Caenorhabditis nigoni]